MRALTDYLETAELEALLQIIDRTRDRLLVRFLFESGCSISEAAAIHTEALASDGTLALQGRTVIISADLARALKENAGTCLFSTRQTTTITPKRIQQILKPYLSQIHNGKTTPHVLRYTHIIHAYKQGVPIRAISNQTGLTSVRVAQIVANIPSPKRYAFQSPLGINATSTRNASNTNTIERARTAARKRGGKT